MRFLEAQALLLGFSSSVTRPLHLCTSGRPEPLDLYIRAACAARGVDAPITSLPFGTLQQHLRTSAGGEHEVLVLFPWDLAPSLDWRSGIPERGVTPSELREALAPVEALLASRPSALFYIPAPLPPVAGDPATQRGLAGILEGAALRLGAHLLPASSFSLPSYLDNGGAFASGRAGELGVSIVSTLMESLPAPRKVLVTDLDGVMWRGVIGEDGPDGVTAAPEGSGYPHFLYQSLLKRLRAHGTLLAAVSRNDEDLARRPFVSGAMTMREDDFVSILASYHHKSAQIASIAEALNLPLDAVVFVDDNPVELAEVSARAPGVTTLRFPETAEEIARFLHELAGLFGKRERTEEDAQRTAMYRTLLSNPVPTGADPGAVEGFLRELGMRLEIVDRSNGDRERAVQLINKTNQFNLNGQRLSDAEVVAILDRGGRLFTALLHDRHGTHGKILACLLGPDESIAALVMSCRVLQRRVEYAFLAWLADSVLQADMIRLEHRVTERNTPMQYFLRDAGFLAGSDGVSTLSRRAYLDAFGSARSLFTLEMPT